MRNAWNLKKLKFKRILHLEFQFRRYIEALNNYVHQFVILRDAKESVFSYCIGDKHKYTWWFWWILCIKVSIYFLTWIETFCNCRHQSFVVRNVKRNFLVALTLIVKSHDFYDEIWSWIHKPCAIVHDCVSNFLLCSF